MKNAILYSRVSTDEQVESGAGLKAQEDACMAFAQQQRWNVISAFVDEGVSGTADLEKRTGLMAAIQALGKDDVLVVAKRDRIGRDVFLIKTIERLVIQRKAQIVALNGAHEETPEASLLNGVMDQFAAYEVAVIRARTKAALAAKKLRGERMGKLPYGFTVAENGVHLVPCLPEQRVLHRIARLRGQGDSLRKIAETLNQERRFNRYGRPWNNVLLHTVCKDLAQRLTA